MDRTDYPFLADLAVCRNPRYKLGQPCIREYLSRVPASEPSADFGGRNAVYAMKYYSLLSGMYASQPKFRQIFKAELEAVRDMVEASLPSTDREVKL